MTLPHSPPRISLSEWVLINTNGEKTYSWVFNSLLKIQPTNKVESLIACVVWLRWLSSPSQSKRPMQKRWRSIGLLSSIVCQSVKAKDILMFMAHKASSLWSSWKESQYHRWWRTSASKGSSPGIRRSGRMHYKTCTGRRLVNCCLGLIKSQVLPGTKKGMVSRGQSSRMYKDSCPIE